MAWCLIEEYANKFKEGIVSGKINPQKLLDMSSEERRAFFAEYVGEFNSKSVNTLFESKLLLKNQQAGLIKWAKKLAGLSETRQNDIIDKINKLDRALNPQTEKQFLADVVEQRLGTQVTFAEAQKITEFTTKLQGIFDSSKPMWEQSPEYWKTKQQLVKFLREIVPDITPTTKFEVFKGGVTTALSVERAIKTGFDLSAPLRQGRALMGTKEWGRAFFNMFKYAKDPVAFDELEVAMMSNKYSEYALKYKSKLGLTQLGETFTQREEQYGAKLIDKVPLLRGSERAFVGFLNDLRFNRFVDILKNLDDAGRGITDDPEAMKALAEVIGSATGRGSSGVAAKLSSLNTVLFSPRWLSSRFELLTNPLTKTGEARKEALRSIGSLMGTTVAMLGMAKMAGLDVEIDPRSTNFGKIKYGNTTFDITGGFAPVITLMTRLGGVIAGQPYTKNAAGVLKELNSGKFGSQTGLDVFLNFFTSKTAPVAGVIRDVLKGQTFGGEELKVDFTDPAFLKYLANQLAVPLLSSDVVGAFNDASGGAVVGAISIPASLFGIGLSTQNPKPSGPKLKLDSLKLPSLKLPTLKL